MRVAFYGGSFNPPHLGHVGAAHLVLDEGEVDEVLVVPVHSHAFAKEMLSFEDRVRLCELAFSGDTRIRVSRIEAELPAPNYTLHTLRALTAQRPCDTFRLLIGADVLQDTPRWHRFDEVEKLAPPLVLGRRGTVERDAPPARLPEVSSSEIRELCRTRPLPEERLRQLMPLAVLEAISSERLYG